MRASSRGHPRRRSAQACRRCRTGGWFSDVAAHVTGTRSFGGRLFLEADALSLVELIEVALHRTAVEEPLLTAVVSNESEASVSHESLDCSGRHPRPPAAATASR